MRYKYIILIVLLCSIFGFTFYKSVEESNQFYKKVITQAKQNNFKVKSTYYSRIYYSPCDEDYIPTVMLTLDLYFPLLAKDFGIDSKNEKPVTVVVYPDFEMMASLLETNIKNVPMGVYHAGVINILSPRLWTNKISETDIKDRFLKEGPLVHELAHYFLDVKTNGNYPLWFTEGVALFYENKYTGFVWRNDLKESSKSIRLETLTKSFRKLDEGKAYRRSYDIINKIVEQSGEQNLQKIIEKMSEGKSFQSALHYVFKKPLVL